MKVMNRTMNRITNVSDKVCEVVSYFSMAVAAFLCIALFLDVVLRKITELGGGAFNVSLTGVYEMCQVGLSLFIFSSWAYVQTVHGHIHVVMFVQRMPQKLRFICFGFTSLLSTVTMVFAAVGLFSKVFDVYDTGEKTANLQIPFWPFYGFEFLAFALLAIVLLFDAVKSIMAIWDTDMAEQIQRDWT